MVIGDKRSVFPRCEDVKRSFQGAFMFRAAETSTKQNRASSSSHSGWHSFVPDCHQHTPQLTQPRARNDNDSVIPSFLLTLILSPPVNTVCQQIGDSLQTASGLDRTASSVALGFDKQWLSGCCKPTRLPGPEKA